MSLYLGTTPVAVNSSSREIGEIIQSTIPLTDAGLHLLDGSLISGSGSYADFVTHIAGLVSNYPELFTTEASWQSSVSTYGVCGKFVYDSTNNTVRLPKITGFTEGTTDVTALGDLVQAGLPNITGTVGTMNDASTGRDSGALSWVSNSSQGLGGNYYGISGTTTFNASASNPIYGNSSTVQPQSIKVLYYIVIATSTKTSIEVDIDEIATDLNGKADVDLSNCTKPHIVETWHSGTSWYRIYSDGWCEQGGHGYYTSDAFYTISYLKPYKDTSYNIQVTQANTGAVYDGSINARRYSVSYKTATDFQIKGDTSSSSNSIDWRACGYIS